MKRLLIVGLLTVALVLAMAVPAMAKNNKPKHSKMVLNVTYKISDPDKDAPAVGESIEGDPAQVEEIDGEQATVVPGGEAWAQHRLNRHVQVWQTPEGDYYVIVKDNGKWSTLPGYEPTEGQAPFEGMVSGNIHGGYIATFEGELLEGAKNGNIGVFDYEGDAPGALPLTYEWLRQYFPGTYDSLDLVTLTDPESPELSLFFVDWAWTYMFQGQKWVNSGQADLGAPVEILAETPQETLEGPVEGETP